MIAYVPIFGWLFEILAQRKNPFVMFHLRQSIGLIVFMVAVFVGWLGLAYLIAFIPYAMVVGMALFTMVIMAFFFCLFAWILGIYNALKEQMAFLPIFGKLAARFLT